MRVFVLLVAVASSVTAHAQPKDLRVPAPEVQTPATKIGLPVVPSFVLPPEEPGFVSVQMLRVAPKPHLDTEVKVMGFITWVYDCLTANAKRGESRAKTQKRIDDDPTLCERPKFYLGSVKNEPMERSLWIVDVPRPPTKLERERLPKEELAAWPKVPKYKLGDYVVVTGKFATSSPHNERNSDGLVVFQALAPAKQPAGAKASSVTPAPRPAIVVPPMQQVVAKPRDEATRMRSITFSNEATRLYADRKYTEAVAAYKQAVAAWPGNHVAYYGLAGSHIGMREWTSARDAVKRAYDLEPNEPMYAMVYAYTLYEGALADARTAQAKKQNVPVDEVVLDASVINHDKALAHMAHALKLEPGLWRASYYTGRMYRDRGDARWAAEAFDAALRSGPRDPGPWVALAELYRRWQYTDEAIAVAKAGTALVQGPASSDVWYVLGMAYDDKRRHADAIAAFTKALSARPENMKARFQRGQSLFVTKAWAKASTDLEAFLSGAAARSDMTFAKQQAQRMVMELAARQK